MFLELNAAKINIFVS